MPLGVCSWAGRNVVIAVPAPGATVLSGFVDESAITRYHGRARPTLTPGGATLLSCLRVLTLQPDCHEAPRPPTSSLTP